MQRFSFDELETKFIESVEPLMNSRSNQKTNLFNQAYFCWLLGDVIVEDNLSPLARAIPQEVFRTTFPALFDAFVAGGTFEAYIEVFKSMFGDNVILVFTVPGPGRLEVDITATGTENFNLIIREIVSEEFVFHNLIDRNGDNILVRRVKNFVTQYELEQALFELVPAGVFTDIDLTV